MKIKYFKALRDKDFKGIQDLFSPVQSEWWMAGITCGFPILGTDKDPQLNEIRKKANLKLYLLYTTVATQILLLGLLDRIK
jgi:hypothetical protein